MPSRARRAGESDPGGAAIRDGVAARHQPMRLWVVEGPQQPSEQALPS